MTNSETSYQQKKYQDIVDYIPEVFRVISDEKTLKILEDHNYNKIIPILRKRPMTIQEITEAFNEEAKKCYWTEPKQPKTIYRYLRVLEDVGLVVPAGRRVVMGKTATEKLYMRTARIFQRKDIEWTSEQGEQWAKRFAMLMGFMLDSSGQEPSVTCIQEFFEKRSKAKMVALERLAKTASDDILELINEGEWEELVHFVDWVFIFGSLMNQPKILEQLRDCLKKP